MHDEFLLVVEDAFVVCLDLIGCISEFAVTTLFWSFGCWSIWPYSCRNVNDFAGTLPSCSGSNNNLF